MSDRTLIVQVNRRTVVVARRGQQGPPGPAGDGGGGSGGGTATALVLSYDGSHWSLQITGTTDLGAPMMDWIPVESVPEVVATSLHLSFDGQTWSLEILGVTEQGAPIVDLVPV